MMVKDHKLREGISGSDADTLPLLSAASDVEGQYVGYAQPKLATRAAAAMRLARGALVRGCGRHPAALAAGALYCVSSGANTLLNKEVLARHNFQAVHVLLLFHCGLAVVLVHVAARLRLAPLEPLTGEVLRLWLPVNIIFVGMLATNFYALQHVGVGMVSILKNLSNLFILVGDYALFRRTYSWQVWACLLLMMGSVATGAATDLHFSLRGYTWQMVNNVFTAAYALYLSHVTARLSGTSPGGGNSNGRGVPAAPEGGGGGGGGGSAGTSGGVAAGGGGGAAAAAAAAAAVTSAAHHERRVGQLSMVYYNNLLSMPLVALLVLITGEWRGLLDLPVLHDRAFQVCATVGGALGFMISFSSIWFMSMSTATIYSLAGSLNKVLLAAAGVWMYNETTEPRNIASIAVGLVAGSLLPFVKSRQRPPRGAGGSASRRTACGLGPRRSGSGALPSQELECVVNVAEHTAGQHAGQLFHKL